MRVNADADPDDNSEDRGDERDKQPPVVLEPLNAGGHRHPVSPLDASDG